MFNCPLVNPDDIIGFNGALVVCGFRMWHTRHKATYLSMADLGTHSNGFSTSASVFLSQCGLCLLHGHYGLSHINPQQMQPLRISSMEFSSHRNILHQMFRQLTTTFVSGMTKRSVCVVKIQVCDSL